MGHWTYECKNERKYVHRDSRTQTLNKRMKEQQHDASATANAQKEKK
jgi:hypothetical protein